MSTNTKIICTIGPASFNKKTIEEMMNSGMGIARLNGSHCSIKDLADMSEKIRLWSSGKVKILVDLPGNKFRTSNIKEKMDLDKDKEIIFKKEMLNHGFVFDCLDEGDQINFIDNNLKLKVVKRQSQDSVLCRVAEKGQLANKKGIVLIGNRMPEMPFIMEYDTEIINAAIKAGIQYIGLSFVRKEEHVRRIKAIVEDKNIKIVAKIETREAVENIDDILDFSEIVMIDRQDLASDTSLEDVVPLQKNIIAACRKRGIDVIVATQFMTSMLKNKRPTIAEVSDISNAVKDEASYLMLSEETAIGEYPVECVRVMNGIIKRIEEDRVNDLKIAILSAGESTGFGSLTENKHKSLLDIGGDTILSHQLRNMHHCGLREDNILILVGSHYKMLLSYLKSKDFRGEFSYNPWYLSTNMLTTLWLSREKLKNGFILVYGDIVFHPDILKDLIGRQADVALAVDQRGGFDEEDEKVVVEKGRVLELSKNIALDKANGEFIGMAKFSKEGSRMFIEEAEKIIRAGNLMSFITLPIEEMIKKGVKVEVCPTKGRPWNDNDNLPDLEKTRKSIYPGIKGCYER